MTVCRTEKASSRVSLLSYSALMTDYYVVLGLVSGNTEPNVVIRELEEALSVFSNRRRPRTTTLATTTYGISAIRWT